MLGLRIFSVVSKNHSLKESILFFLDEKLTSVFPFETKGKLKELTVASFDFVKRK